MAHIFAGRVKETSVTTGTGAYALGGPYGGYRSFANAPMSIGDTCDYYAAMGADYETGIGTYSGSNTLSRTVIKASSNAGAAVSWAAGTKEVGLSPIAARYSNLQAMQRGLLAGYKITPSGGNSITVSDGIAGADAAPWDLISRTTSITKTSGAWNAGTSNGGLDTGGSVSASTWYFPWAIGKLDGTSDVLISASSTSPTMPSGYVLKRRLGAVRANASSQFTTMTQYGNWFFWSAPVIDANSIAAQGAGPVQTTIALTVPPIAGIIARFRATVVNATQNAAVMLSAGLETPTTITAGYADIYATAAGNAGQFDLAVNASRQIKTISGHASTIIWVGTLGWYDPFLRGE